MKYLCLLLLINVVVFPSSAITQDRIFTYTYQSSVLNPGQRELEPWTTFRIGKKDFYRRIDNRIEFETGLVRNLQTSFYLNSTTASAAGDSSIHTDTELSFSNEWKFKISDAIADPVGLALYGEWTLGSKEFELEGKLIFDKQIGRWITAFNIVGEMEWEKEAEGSEIETESESVLEFDYALAWQFSKGFHAGIEARSHNDILKGKWQHSALFVGPVVSYARDNFWINVTVLPQVAALKGATHKNLVLDSHEKMETRIIFSYAF